MKSKWDTSRKSSQIDRSVVKDALQDLQNELRRIYGNSAPAILIYGSYARGEENADSDVDILLIYQNAIHPSKEIQRISAVLADLNLRYQVLISILPGTALDYKNGKGVLWQNLRRESIPIEQF